MLSLKELRQRITSVKSTRKITSAMKMVAASKLRRAQEEAEAARPYAERIERIVENLIVNSFSQMCVEPLLTGTGYDNTYLLIVITANRGLCGAFNSTIVREVRSLIINLVSAGKTVKILCVGRKGHDQLKRGYDNLIISPIKDVESQRPSFSKASVISAQIIHLFSEGFFDNCTIIFNRFQSAMNQIVTRQQLIPFPAKIKLPISQDPHALYEYEPSEESLLTSIAPHNLTIQIFRALLESVASEHSARMTAMDNATRSASDIINDLTLTYNRTRQAYITKELIEIISGAEAL